MVCDLVRELSPKCFKKIGFGNEYFAQMFVVFGCFFVECGGWVSKIDSTRPNFKLFCWWMSFLWYMKLIAKTQTVLWYHPLCRWWTLWKNNGAFCFFLTWIFYDGLFTVELLQLTCLIEINTCCLSKILRWYNLYETNIITWILLKVFFCFLLCEKSPSTTIWEIFVQPPQANLSIRCELI